MPDRLQLWIAERILWAFVAAWLGVNATLIVGTSALARTGWDAVYAANDGPIQRASLVVLRSYYESVVR